MRAPQYGVNGYKASKRGRLNWLAPHAAPYVARRPRNTRNRFKSKLNVCPARPRMIRHKAPAPIIAAPKPGRAVGLRGVNAPLPMRSIRYQPPKTALYEDGTYGAPCIVHLHYAYVDGVIEPSGPIVSKRYTVVEHRHSK